MKEQTRNEYLALAAHFCATRLNGLPPSPGRLTAALEACAPEYRPAYWRRLRGALALAQEEAGYPSAAARIRAIRNPASAAGTQPKKQNRVKGITPADRDRLADYLAAKGDLSSITMLVLCQELGCRPAEILGLSITRDGFALIPGAKARDDRGIDVRRLQLPPSATPSVIDALNYLRQVHGSDLAAELGRVQDRVTRAGKKLWPRRKAAPSLYSFRHQMGSDLKASGMSRREIAYVMGHRSTESVDVYGDRRRAQGSTARLPKPADGADLSVIRDNHRLPPKSTKKLINLSLKNVDSLVI